MPGLDGTGKPFESFRTVLPQDVSTSTVVYPSDPDFVFADLVEIVSRRLPMDRSFVLIAESFSGPIAIRVAASAPPGLRALALSASFAMAPVAPLISTLNRFLGNSLFKLSPLAFVLRHLFLGKEAPSSLVEKTADVIEALDPLVLASRANMALNINTADDLHRVQCPMLYLRGKQDRRLRADIANEISKLKPNMILRDIDGPHFLLQVKPEECWLSIQWFLDSLDSGSSA